MSSTDNALQILRDMRLVHKFAVLVDGRGQALEIYIVEQPKPTKSNKVVVRKDKQGGGMLEVEFYQNQDRIRVCNKLSIGEFRYVVNLYCVQEKK